MLEHPCRQSFWLVRPGSWAARASTSSLALAYRSVSIVRPSLLLGDRAEFRLGEEVAKRFAFLAPGKYKPIHARDVAAALVRLAREPQPGHRIVESAEMRGWAQGPPGANRVPVS